MKQLLAALIILAASAAGPGEILTNRDFENKEDHMAGWSVKNAQSFVEDKDPVHPITPHYLTVLASSGTVVTNDLGGGLSVRKGEILDFTIHANSLNKGKMVALLINGEGEIVAAGVVNVRKNGWKEYKTSLQADRDASGCTLDIVLPAGRISLDAASLVSDSNYR